MPLKSDNESRAQRTTLHYVLARLVEAERFLIQARLSASNTWALEAKALAPLRVQIWDVIVETKRLIVLVEDIRKGNEAKPKMVAKEWPGGDTREASEDNR